MILTLKKITLLSLLGTAVVLTGCGGSSGGGGASVPAGAITLTEANAQQTIESATSSLDSFSVVGYTSTSSITAKEALKMIDQIKQSNSPTLATATGVTASVDCTGGGTASNTWTENGNTESGTITFTNCIESGFTFNGSLSYSETFNFDTGDYSDTASGNLTIEDSANGIKVSFTGLDLAESGNEFDGTYTTTKFTMAVNFTANGTTGGGFLFELTTPIVESTGDFCPESGSFKITGANNTTAELIYNGDGTTTIKANGTVVNPSAPCYN